MLYNKELERTDQEELILNERFKLENISETSVRLYDSELKSFPNYRFKKDLFFKSVPYNHYVNDLFNYVEFKNSNEPTNNGNILLHVLAYIKFMYTREEYQELFLKLEAYYNNIKDLVSTDYGKSIVAYIENKESSLIPKNILKIKDLQNLTKQFKNFKTTVMTNGCIRTTLNYQLSPVQFDELSSKMRRKINIQKDRFNPWYEGKLALNIAQSYLLIREIFSLEEAEKFYSFLEENNKHLLTVGDNSSSVYDDILFKNWGDYYISNNSSAKLFKKMIDTPSKSILEYNETSPIVIEDELVFVKDDSKQGYDVQSKIMGDVANVYSGMEAFYKMGGYEVVRLVRDDRGDSGDDGGSITAVLKYVGREALGLQKAPYDLPIPKDRDRYLLHFKYISYNLELGSYIFDDIVNEVKPFDTLEEIDLYLKFMADVMIHFKTIHDAYFDEGGDTEFTLRLFDFIKDEEWRIDEEIKAKYNEVPKWFLENKHLIDDFFSNAISIVFNNLGECFEYPDGEFPNVEDVKYWYNISNGKYFPNYTLDADSIYDTDLTEQDYKDYISETKEMNQEDLREWIYEEAMSGDFRKVTLVPR